MRLKYPHIAIGALAASAPILQFEDVVPPETFYDIVSNDFRVYSITERLWLMIISVYMFDILTPVRLFSWQRESVSCFNTIKDSWDVIESEGHKQNGLSYLTETFRFCKYVALYNFVVFPLRFSLLVMFLELA